MNGDTNGATDSEQVIHGALPLSVIRDRISGVELFESVDDKLAARALQAMDPPLVGRRRLNLMYVTQTASAPPRVRFFSNVERDIPAHYVRFLETRFREALKLVGTPLRLEFRRTGRTFVGPRGATSRPQDVRARRR